MSRIFEIFGNDAHSMTLALLEKAEVCRFIPTGA